MKYLLLFLVVAAFVLENCSAATWYRNVAISNVTSYAVGPECKSPGILCDCDQLDTVYFCIRIGPKDFIKQVIDKCEAGFTCNDNEDGCSDKINFACEVMPDYQMDCTSIGIFPDPYNCKKYHICVTEDGASSGKSMDNSIDDVEFAAKPRKTTTTSDEDITTSTEQGSTTPKPDPKPTFKTYSYKCDDGYAYNLGTAFCDIPLIDNQCDHPLLEPCKKASLSPVAIADNPSFYYLCIFNEKNPGKYTPKIFKCDHGEKFINGECFNAMDNIDCKSKQNVADENNCLSYYDCSTGNPQYKQCPPGRSFHKKKLTCVQGYSNC